MLRACMSGSAHWPYRVAVAMACRTMIGAGRSGMEHRCQSDKSNSKKLDHVCYDNLKIIEEKRKKER